MTFRSIFALAVSAVILALPHSALASGSGGVVTPTDISSVGDGVVLIYADGIQNPDSCTHTGFVVIPTTVTNQSNHVAVALTAFALGRQVYFWVNGCQTVGAYTVPKVWQITMK